MLKNQLGFWKNELIYKALRVCGEPYSLIRLKDVQDIFLYSADVTAAYAEYIGNFFLCFLRLITESVSPTENIYFGWG